MAMKKFKVGDRVRLRDNVLEAKKGSIGTVHKSRYPFEGDNTFLVDIDGFTDGHDGGGYCNEGTPGPMLYIDPYDLELVEV